tara:strand:+ start:590 stop:1039 length:450 start_codon:yes stop_codon:yes gene_type:complete
LVKLKGHRFLIDNPDAKASSVISELLLPNGENNIIPLLQYCFKNNFKLNEVNTIVGKILESFVDYEIQEYYKSENLILNKSSTKKEITRRPYLAKCFIHDNYKDNILLEDISKSAFLSKYIFQIYFKSYFQISPSDYLLQLRLKKLKNY